MEMKETIKKIIETYKVENEDLDPSDCAETVLYELFMNRDSKNLIIDGKTEKSLTEVENVIFTNLDEKSFEVILFGDDYNGYRLKMEDVNGNLKVVSAEKVDENVIENTEDIDISEIL